MKIKDRTYIHDDQKPKLSPKGIISIIALIAVIYFMGETLVYTLLFHVLPCSFSFYMGIKVGVKIGKRSKDS